MPGNNENTPEGEVVPSAQPDNQGGAQMSQALQAGMMQIFGDQETYKPTKSQVDKMLALQEKGMDYTHAERTMYQPKQVMQLISFVVLLLFVIGLIWLVLVKAPQDTGEVISSVIGLIGGGGVGYGYGTRKRNSDSDE